MRGRILPLGACLFFDGGEFQICRYQTVFSFSMCENPVGR